MTATVSPSGRDEAPSDSAAPDDAASPRRPDSADAEPLDRPGEPPADQPAAALGPRTLVRLGAAGAALLLIGSLGAGAMPGYDVIAHVPVLSAFRSGSLGLRAAMALAYAGLALMVGSWLLLGRALYAPQPGQPITVALLRRAALAWSIPLALCAPLFSRDLYSYAAQAQIAHAGLNPYQATPADLPGRFLDEVAWRWVDSPAPYGPLWLMLGKVAAAIAGDGVMRTVLAVRLLCIIGVALVVWLLPRLAALTGGRPEAALWLGALNPLVLVHLIAGGHNDALMLGLGVAGLALAAMADGRARGLDSARLAGGAAIIAMAIAVKSPAAVMLAFAPLIWLQRRGQLRDLRQWIVASALALGSATAAFAAVTAISGMGLGWIKQVNSSIPVVNWLSLPTSLAMLWRALHGVGLDRQPDGTVEAFRTAGTAITVIAVLACWAAARRWSPLTLCAIALGITVLLGPSVQPWYYVWALSLAAATAAATRPRVGAWLAFLSVALMLSTLPEGQSIVGKPIPLLLVLAAAAAAAWSALGGLRAAEPASPDP